MPKHTYTIAAVLSVLFLLGLMGLSLSQRGTRIEQLQTELDRLRSTTEQQRASAATLTNELSEARAQIEELQQEKDKVTHAQKNLEDQMRAALESKDITISQLQGKLTVSILDRILFDSGEAALKPEGEQVLKQIAGILQQFPQRQIHVIGHTDNVPIRASGKARYPTNWELSAARATAAVRYLVEKEGVDPRRVGAVGYGEFRPLADNSTAEGKAKNRRIAVVVLSEELVGSDAVNSPTPAQPTPENK